MNVLAFEDCDERVDGRRIRRTVFRERSNVPLGAACLVANLMRETLASLCGDAADVRVFEPVIPARNAWSAIARDAAVFRIAARSDIALVLRPCDAAALARLPFGEYERPLPALSPIEQRVLHRAVRALLPSLAPLGVGHPAPEPIRTDDATGLSTYIELRVERPAAFSLGIALASEPESEAPASRALAELAEVPLALSFRARAVSMTAADVVALEPGSFVPITGERSIRGALCVAGRPLAYGECGVRSGRLAVNLEGTL